MTSQRKLPVNAICFVGVLISFLILECIENFMPTWKIPIIVVKGLTSAIPVGLALFSAIKLPDYFNIGFTSVLFTYFIGDILIRINFVAGVIAFFVASSWLLNTAYIISFIRSCSLYLLEVSLGIFFSGMGYW